MQALTRYRVLLDACLPQELRHRLLPHDVATAHFYAWDHLDIERLLRVMVGERDVLVTSAGRWGKRARWRSRYPLNPVLAVVVLNSIDESLLPGLLQALAKVRPGEVRQVPSQSDHAMAD